MSIPLRFDVHIACINAATNMDEFVRANELAVLDEQYANLFTSVPCCDRRLICMCRYGEPVNMAIDFDQVEAGAITPPSDYTTAAPIAGPARNATTTIGPRVQ
jgi:hypothetical protein